MMGDLCFGILLLKVPNSTKVPVIVPRDISAKLAVMMWI